MEAKTGTQQRQLASREVHGELNEYKREEQWLARKCIAILRNDHTSRSLNSFNQRFFAISFSILCSHFRCTWSTGQKHVPCLLTLIHTCQFKARLLRYVYMRRQEYLEEEIFVSCMFFDSLVLSIRDLAVSC